MYTSYLSKTTNTINTYTLLLIICLAFVSCRSLQTQVVQEPTQSDLSTIKDKLFYLIMSEDDQDKSMLTFYICPSWLSFEAFNKMDMNTPKECVPAFLDEKGIATKFSKRLIIGNDELLATKKKREEDQSDYTWVKYVNLNHKYSLFANMTMIAGLIIYFYRIGPQAFNIPILLSVPASMMAVDRIAARHNRNASWRCIDSLEKINKSISQQRANTLPTFPGSGGNSQGFSQEFSPTYNALLDLKASVQYACNRYRLSVWVNQSDYTLLADAFQDIISNDPSNVLSISTRIPQLLPQLASLLKTLEWVDEEGISFQCLPRYNKPKKRSDPICLTPHGVWDTGNRWFYKNPTNMKKYKTFRHQDIDG